jgi:hypothetical protein
VGPEPFWMVLKTRKISVIAPEMSDDSNKWTDVLNTTVLSIALEYGVFVD